MLKIFRYWIPVLFILAAIFYLSSLPAKDLPKIWFLNWPFADKVEHFGIYGLLGFAIARALSGGYPGFARFSEFKRFILITTVLGAAYGILDEFHQSFVPGRSVDAFDVVADTLGAFSGSCLAFLYRKWNSL